jgi:uncharacterized protein (UPF0335 family)
MPVSVEDFIRLNKVNEENSRKRIRLEERFESAKKALSAKVKDIEADGFDPKTLPEQVARLEAEVEREFAEYKAAVEAQSRALEGIEALL